MKRKEALLNAKEQYGRSADYFIPIIQAVK
jgi:hypothetical protein